MNPADSLKSDMRTTVEKTLLTVSLFDGFWDRWIAHGVDRDDLSRVRESYLTKDRWIQDWKQLADAKFAEAENLQHKGSNKDAEMLYRTSALYYQLIQWLIPEHGGEKLDWLNRSLKAVKEADQLSSIETKYVEIMIGEHLYFGRVRVPSNPRGAMIMINPLDSAKEELFTYEMEFADKGFITLNFDGPGQGQTYTIQGLKGTIARWESYVDGLIEYAASNFMNQEIYLFGTSSGAAWSIYGSCNPKVTKAVAVSPAIRTHDIKMPDYFLERMDYVTENRNILPSYDGLSLKKPVLLVHGKKDVMLKDESIYALYEQLREGKAYIEYEDEGHCCNYKLPEIRHKAMKWFEGKWGGTNEI